MIEETPDRTLQAVARFLFSSILKTTCSQRRHWGWVCDNVAPKKDEIEEKDAIATFTDALAAYEEGLAILRLDMRRRGTDPDSIREGTEWSIVRGDACTRLQELDVGSVDAVVTSPPYFGVADYVKSQRLTFLWFHPDVTTIHEFGGFESLRAMETGARSFRHRRSAFEDYSRYMELFLERTHGVLRAGGTMCLVMGESSVRQAPLVRLRDAAAKLGFGPVFEYTRDIRSNRRRLKGSVRDERIIVYRRE